MSRRTHVGLSNAYTIIMHKLMHWTCLVLKDVVMYTFDLHATPCNACFADPAVQRLELAARTMESWPEAAKFEK